MIVTEQEAGNKFCPFIRAYTYDLNAQEGSPPVYEHIKCLGARCMAWRWVDEFPTFQPAGDRRGTCGMTMLLGVAS